MARSDKSIKTIQPQPAALTPGATATARRALRTRSKWREGIEAIVVAFALALFFRQFLVQAFRIPSSSMESTLLVGDFLFVNKFLYGAQVPFTSWRLPALRQPKAGDIIVFKSPTDGRDFIKRCVAVAGDTLEIRGKALYVNGRKRDEPYTQHTDRGVMLPSQAPRDYMGPLVIPEGHIFMMGDNRDNSHDSRFWGPLEVSRVRGKAMFIYFSIDMHEAPFLRATRIGDLIR